VSQGRRDLDRRIARLAIPAVGAIAAEPLYNLADTAIVGHLGSEPLDALALAASTLSVVVWLAIFLQTATTTEVARHAARGQHDAAGRVVGAAYAVAAGWGVVTSAIVAGIAPWLVGLLGGHEASGAATSYIRVAVLGLPFLYLSYAGNGHLTGLEDTRTPLRIAVGANAVNVALELWLVFGLHTGLIGSAWGTVAAQVLAAAAYGYASWRSSYPPARPGRSEVAALLRDGHRLSVRTIALGGVAGQQVAYRIWGLLSLSTDALAVPAQVFVSAALSRGDRAAAEQAARRTLVLGLIAGIGLGVLTAALALLAPAAFTADPAVRSAAVTGLLWSALTQPLAAVAFVYDGIILGLGDYSAMRRTMLWAIVAFAPLAILVLRFHWLGLPGVWVALGCWLAARTVMLGRRWRRAQRETLPEGTLPEGASVVGGEAELGGEGEAGQGDGDPQDADREVAR
jgi:Na+-driven multidrug efflux pump